MISSHLVPFLSAVAPGILAWGNIGHKLTGDIAMKLASQSTLDTISSILTVLSPRRPKNPSSLPTVTMHSTMRLILTALLVTCVSASQAKHRRTTSAAGPNTASLQYAMHQYAMHVKPLPTYHLRFAHQVHQANLAIHPQVLAAGPVKPSNGGLDQATYQRLTQAAWFIDMSFKPAPDYNDPERWSNLTSDYGVKQGDTFCINGREVCWILDKILGADRWIVQGKDRESNQPATWLRLLDSSSQAINDLTMRLNGLANVVNVFANGQFPYHSVSGSQQGFALAMELPASSVENEMIAIANLQTSLLFKKPVVQRVLKDIINGLQQVHQQGVRLGPRPSNVLLFNAAGPSYTAKLSHFDNFQDMNPAQDTTELGDSFLDWLVATLFDGAWKHAGKPTGCSPPPSNDPFLQEVCDIVINLDRISQNLQRNDSSQWTLDQVLQDQWMTSS